MNNKEEIKRAREKVIEYYKANIFTDIFYLIGINATYIFLIGFLIGENKNGNLLVLVFMISAFFIIYYLIVAFRDIKNPLSFSELHKIKEKDSEFILKDNLSQRVRSYKPFVYFIFIITTLGLLLSLIGDLLDLFFS